ncbi:MAG: cyclic nucleotide-binding domain-containing protein [Thermoguttaceae bacterium]|jgi:CRP-like cAMP-binding protein
MVSPEILRRYPYFAAISDESLKRIAMVAEEKCIKAGTPLFGEGDPASHLSVILRGEVNIQYLLGNGELRTVDTLVPGDLLGWSAIIEPFKYTAIGVTTRDTELLCVDGVKLREIFEHDPLLGYRLAIQVAKLLAHRLEGARVQLAAVT